MLYIITSRCQFAQKCFSDEYSSTKYYMFLLTRLDTSRPRDVLLLLASYTRIVDQRYASQKKWALASFHNPSKNKTKIFNAFNCTAIK